LQQFCTTVQTVISENRVAHCKRDVHNHYVQNTLQRLRPQPTNHKPPAWDDVTDCYRHLHLCALNRKKSCGCFHCPVSSRWVSNASI